MELEVVTGGLAVDISYGSLAPAIDVEVSNSPQISGVALSVVPTPGPTGPQGPPGAGGFTYTQSTASASWSVTHGLGRYPLASEIVVGNEVVNADITYPTVNTVSVVFASPQSGFLRLV